MKENRDLPGDMVDVVKKLDQELNSDDALNARFAKMRQEALNHIPSEASRRWNIMGMPGLALSACAALVLVALVGLYPSLERPSGGDEIDMMTVLLEAEDIEMLEDEIEFYMWLEEELEHKG